MFTLSDTTYSSGIGADKIANALTITPADYMNNIVIDDKYMRSFIETWCGKMTDAQYAMYVYRGRWQSVFPKFRGKIPNDFKSKA